METLGMKKDMELLTMFMRYRDMAQALEGQIKSLNDLKKKVQQRALSIGEPGEVLEIEEATLSIRKGYVRRTWNGKGLDGYAIAHPEILSFVSSREIGPTAAITVER